MATEVVTYLHVCLSGDANTAELSHAALQAAVPVAMGADLHPAVPGNTASLVCGTHYKPSSHGTTETQPPWKNTGGFLLHANHFMVFHQKITFLRTPTVTRTDPTVTYNLFHLQLMSNYSHTPPEIQDLSQH